MNKEIFIKLDNNQKTSINVEKNFIPVNKQLLVKNVEQIKKNDKSNLILSSSTLKEAKYSIAIVIQLDQEIKNVKEGDLIIYKKGWAPVEIDIEGTKYYFVKYEDISGVYNMQKK